MNRKQKVSPAATALVFEEPIPIVRVDVLPDKCPNCKRDNSRRTASAGATGTGWHHYRFIPQAPAVGCGACGHIVYTEDSEYERIRAATRDDFPKAAAGKIKTRRRA